MTKKKQDAPKVKFAKIRPDVHEAIKKHADENGQRFIYLLDKVIRDGMRANDIINA